ncbi:hypothetical protein BLA39750_02944 [Burkholderia lata]|uniref:Lipoprotein n=1 Tax=Burkholderia lata (strain ATCC 17760 / DSM 23089 / LMG 22485 / NCIMB 9086 / R18194 / 383) TaxID=482957 RepID=A0A6P2XB27_BURL3|nr:hypothetical protein [Burkholderia lata]VWD06740.1 hypothetical protein BLA39750_02944 [Burkholderia lata]
MTDRLSRYARRTIQTITLVAVIGLGACDKHPGPVAQLLGLSSLPKDYDTLGASSLTLNYAPWYIHQWGIEGQDGSEADGALAG